MTEEFQILSPDEVRDTGAFLPEWNGITVWMKELQCEFCTTDLKGNVMLLQWNKRSDLHFMCVPCFHRLLQKADERYAAAVSHLEE